MELKVCYHHLLKPWLAQQLICLAAACVASSNTPRKLTVAGSTKSDVLKFGPVSEQGSETRFHKDCNLLLTKCFINVNLSSWSTVVSLKTLNLELCFRTNVGTNQATIEKILISRAILLNFLRSLVRVIRFEASRINWRREEWPFG